MNRLWICLLVGAAVAGLAQQPVLPDSPDEDVMLAAVSRDESMLAGGIGGTKWTGRGTIVVEPLARLTRSGEWKSLPCTRNTTNTTYDRTNCLRFAHEYLNRPHAYAVISADGKGATVQAAPTTLSECYDYRGTGTYAGATIAKSAIAASSADSFVDSASLQSLNEEETKATRKALALLVPSKLDSIERLRLAKLRLEGQDLIIVQRAFADIAGVRQASSPKLIFAIGTMGQGRVRIVHWKKNVEDEDERVLGTFALKSGREFLVAVVGDPESHWYRVYGIRDGHLDLIYSGGGSSC